MTLEKKVWDLLLVVTAAPHSTDVITSALRLSQAVLDNGGSVRFWACGYATMLTQTTHGDTKPANTRDPDGDYPSPAAIARRMIEAGGGRFGWIGCTACSEERGATQHIPQVRRRSPARLAATMAAAKRTLYLGGA
jgi:sulfur relay (sulfurtransferase) complex TusBCD TusD component (DsrE family)